MRVPPAHRPRRRPPAVCLRDQGPAARVTEDPGVPERAHVPRRTPSPEVARKAKEKFGWLLDGAFGGPGALGETYLLEEFSDADLAPESSEKTNDPVRMYLREMGTVALLTQWVILLPVIAFILVVDLGSVILQVADVVAAMADAGVRGAQVAFDLGYHGFAEAIAAYNHDRVQPMRSGAQCAPLLRGQFVHRAS